MKIHKGLILIGTLILALVNLPKITYANTDYSIYSIETGEFLGEENVRNALYKLQADTGWYAQYQSTGKSIPYYQVISDEIIGESNAREQLNNIERNYGVSGTYSPVGLQAPSYKIISGGFKKDIIQGVLEDFKQSTGISATTEPTGQRKAKERIVTGGFYGENAVKDVVYQFTQATGIDATYRPMGEYKEYKQVLSGGFYGEENTKLILQEFVKSTGVDATYEAVQYSETYNVITGGFYGEETVQSVLNRINSDLGVTGTVLQTNLENIYQIKFDSLSESMMTKLSKYLNDNNWWYSASSNGKIGVVFRIVSEPLLNEGKLTEALNYFTSRNWWATISPTGMKENMTFQIVSSPIDDQSKLDVALNFFKEKGWWVTKETTNEYYYPYYQIVTEPIVEKDKLNAGLAFFKTNNWWVSTAPTGNSGYTTFRLVTNPILGYEKASNIKNSLENNGYKATTQATGDKEGYYKIVTGGFLGYENANANAQMLTERYGWWVTTVLIKSGPTITKTFYDVTLDSVLNAQMKMSPQTDLYRNDSAWVSLQYIDSNNKVTATSLNVRSGPGTSYDVVASLSNGSGVTILERKDGWARILLTWRNAKREDVLYYLNPNNFQQGTNSYYQFLDLSKSAGLNVSEVNQKILLNKGILTGKAQAFVDASKAYNINEIYLMSHAFLETGNGTSQLAKGVLVSTVDGKPVTPRWVYNMYGIGAYDGTALRSGSEYAYKQGWFTPEQAIIGGAKFISERYVNHAVYKQNTLYKMRWNPSQPGIHQYATDIAWAYKQVSNISKLYDLLDTYKLVYDVPVYK
ncbi:N-acetylglucosaminidase [Bacillus sp. AGMB 02131]|uniref:N-acetylglucosaminidase n=1 Tax=Peribacillus faecalis TaxID=2772559 RepID=A0A927HBC7_9BACI|nr:N-acetylglucosaminidase [Peribacillus faecalis]MBD3108366.1 N-acetylglucosaminidase [Peribacillus faecalis]